MAKNKSTVYLGYQDEEITEKHKSLLNYTVNKIGGTPDWSHSGIIVPNCPICSLSRPLILQIYAPIDNSQFHRTLYIFSCINPTCSSISKSWLCIRTQTLEKTQESEGVNKAAAAQISLNTSSWCSGADDWDEIEDNRNEENGNVIRNDNRISDDDDDSNSMENDIVGGFVNLNVGDDKNANCGAQGGTNLTSTNIYAEIEGEESEVVTVETPLAPERDLIALLKQTPGVSQNVKNLVLKSFFIAVEEETSKSFSPNDLTDHERELLQEYQMKDELCRSNPDYLDSVLSSSGIGDCEQETYEKSIPTHGDIMFHNFITIIQRNPEQILRYSRDNFPLLIAPLHELIPKCQNCGGECICEIQILPTLIPKLKLINGDPAPLEFGNVLIFTCIKSCWDTPDRMRIEHVIVQQEA